jgi:glutamate synthase (NADPH) small chain
MPNRKRWRVIAVRRERVPVPNAIANKDRMKMPRQHMPEREAPDRCRSFEEVNLGFDPARANEEALRCLACAKPTCTRGCPVAVKVKDFVSLIIEGDYLGAAAKIREDNALPAITGRVCPQEDQCEGDCVMTRKVDSLAIGHLERFVADRPDRSAFPGTRRPRAGAWPSSAAVRPD